MLGIRKRFVLIIIFWYCCFQVKAVSKLHNENYSYFYSEKSEKRISLFVENRLKGYETRL